MSNHNLSKYWDRRLWAVEFNTPGGLAFLISEVWNGFWTPRYRGAPDHCLLFLKRADARQWCKEATATHAKHEKGWTFRPVRVRETVCPIHGQPGSTRKTSMPGATECNKNDLTLYGK